MKKIFILTGEPSGDKLASKVISKLKKNNQHVFLDKTKCIKFANKNKMFILVQ